MKFKFKETINLAIIAILFVYGRRLAIESFRLMSSDNGTVWAGNCVLAFAIALVVFVSKIRWGKNPTLLNTSLPALVVLVTIVLIKEMFWHHPEIGLKILKETISLREWVIIAVVTGVFLIPIGRAESEKEIKKIRRNALKRKEEWEKKRKEKKDAKEAAKAAKLAARNARRQRA